MSALLRGLSLVAATLGVVCVFPATVRVAPRPPPAPVPAVFDDDDDESSVTASYPREPAPKPVKTERISSRWFRWEQAERGQSILARLLTEVGSLPAPRVYVGLPHPRREDLFARALTRPHVVRHGYPYYEKPAVLSPERLRSLLADATDPARYQVWSPKLCGSFHPDFAFVWTRGSTELELSLCLGCCEAAVWMGDEEGWVSTDGCERRRSLYGDVRAPR